MKRKLWKINELTDKAGELSEKFKISSILAQVLINRNIKEPDFDSFLDPSLSRLHPPYLLPDMEKSVERIKRAVRAAEKILAVGDYDVDGITSLAIFNEFTKGFKNQFSFYIPHRVTDGYGLNIEVIKKAQEQRVSLIIAFDCGTGAVEEIDSANRAGMDVIVIDHHQPKEVNDKPYAFINPKRKDSTYPFPDLSSGALSFKLLQALKGSGCWEALDLVALSLICDVVPLRGENRILIKEGIKQLKRSKRPAVEALCKASSLKKERIDTFHIGYILGPRINASGRVAHAKDSLNIFLTEDEKVAGKLASKLCEYNILRRGIEADILRDIEVRQKEFEEPGAIVVYNQDWHPGVLGIVASRLVDKYYRPCFVISFQENVGKGSGRSIHSLHLTEVLGQCSEFLSSYGGHRKAAGIEIFKKDLEGFRMRLNTIIKEKLTFKDFVPVMDVDLELNFKDIDNFLISDLEKLKPLGEEVPGALFVSRNVFKKSPLKKINNAYSLWLSDGFRVFEGVIYNKEILDLLSFGEVFDIAYALDRNAYHNTPKLIIKDCRLS